MRDKLMLCLLVQTVTQLVLRSLQSYIDLWTG